MTNHRILRNCCLIRMACLASTLHIAQSLLIAGPNDSLARPIKVVLIDFLNRLYSIYSAYSIVQHRAGHTPQMLRHSDNVFRPKQFSNVPLPHNIVFKTPISHLVAILFCIFVCLVVSLFARVNYCRKPSSDVVHLKALIERQFRTYCITFLKKKSQKRKHTSRVGNISLVEKN